MTQGISSRGRPSRAQADQKRHNLLRIARKNFLAKGFAGTTIESIAEQSGMSKSTLYAHFGGKEELFRAVTKHACNVPAHNLAKVKTHGRDPQAVLTEFIRIMFKDAQDPDSLALLRLAIFESARFPDIAQAIYQASQDVLVPIYAYLTELEQQGCIHDLDLGEIVQDMVSLCTGGYAFLLSPPCHGIDESRVQRVLGMILKNLGLALPNT